VLGIVAKAVHGTRDLIDSAFAGINASMLRRSRAP
jgi:hypothetical protein